MDGQRQKTGLGVIWLGCGILSQAGVTVWATGYDDVSFDGTMKIIFNWAGVLLLSATILPGADQAVQATANFTNQFSITGMHCDGCAKGVRSELRAVPGVAEATVSLTNKLAIVVYDTNRVSEELLIKVVKEAGYEAKPAVKR